ncbi:hypothetical protein ACF3OH_12775 [Chryseomicrobium aureum]|uniref:hypothetical protein n=1 Tax=Chryseomicrobium aureum TaxID=1441723 RepID=UPI00370D561E
MKRLGVISGILFIVAGCSGNFPSEIEGEIFKVEEDSIHIAIYGDDPEAEYPVYEVIIDDATIIEKVGANSASAESLEIGDRVVAEIRDREKQIASKIVVEEE